MPALPDTLAFEVSERIARCPGDLFRAVTRPECSCRYFMVGATAPMTAGARPTWSWPVGRDVTVAVTRADPPPVGIIEFTWQAHQVDYDTSVTISITDDPAAPGASIVRVRESGWRPDAPGLASSYEHCAGWQHMLSGLKAWAMHAIDHRSPDATHPALPDAPERPQHANPFPELHTDRLHLRRHRPDDLPVMAERFSDMEVVRYTLRMPFPYTLAHAEAFYRSTRIAAAAGRTALWAITLRDTCDLIGGIGLRIEPDHATAELGYVFTRSQWGRGYATEAARAVTRYAFESLKLERIEASYFTANPASGRVLEKIGFVREGVHRSKAVRFGERLDLVITAALRDQWNPAPAGA